MKCPSRSDMDRLYQMLSKGTNKPAILSLITPYSNMYVPPRTTHTGLPPVLQLLHNPDYMKLTYDELLSKSESININISAEMASRLEAETRSQHKSKMWFRFRAGRVTASKMKAACHTDVANPSISLLNSICYPEVFSFSSKQTSWGNKHEKDGINLYKKMMELNHANFVVQLSGLVINPEYPFLGASPDGIVSCDCCGIGLVEIKCPYSHRHKPIELATEDSTFCWKEKSDKHLSLDQSHSYSIRFKHNYLFVTSSTVIL